MDAVQNDDWEEQIGHVISFFKGLFWWRLIPADTIVMAQVEQSGDGEREFNAGGRTRTHALPPEMTYWAMADAGMLYVVYVRGTTEEVTVALDGGAYYVAQYNPRTGEHQDLGETHTSFTFTPPDEQDWVVVIERK